MELDSGDKGPHAVIEAHLFEGRPQINLRREYVDGADDELRRRTDRLFRAVQDAIDEEYPELGVVGGGAESDREYSEAWDDEIPAG